MPFQLRVLRILKKAAAITNHELKGDKLTEDQLNSIVQTAAGRKDR
jgi:hypothetical protein